MPVRIASLFALFATLWLAMVHAEEPPPVLMIMDYDIAGTHRSQTVSMKSGEFKLADPLPGADRLRLLPGDAFAANEARPPDRGVELYQDGAQGRTLVCIVRIRYFRSPAGPWIAHFQMIEEPLVARDAQGNWKPFTEIRGAPGLIVLTSSTLPNAEGFYPSLQFGMNLKKVHVNSWVVR